MPKIGVALLGNARRITCQSSVFDNNILAVVPLSIETRYLYYWLSTQELGRLSNPGPIPSLDDSALLDLAVPIVAIQEQRAIADFLDTETARIDALITKKRRLINLLDERYKSVRTSTVLRGLDPVHGYCEPDMPDSWSVAALGVLVMLHRGFDLPSEERDPGEFPVVSSGGISGRHSLPMCSAPGVVTGRYGTVGEVFFLDEPYWPLNTTLFVSDFRGNDP